MSSADDFADEMRLMFKGSDICIMSDAAAGHVLQAQGDHCIVFTSQGPPLLQITRSQIPQSFADKEASVGQVFFFRDLRSLLLS